MTATTGRPAAASSSSRKRVTPGRKLANLVAPHTRHTDRPLEPTAAADQHAVVGQADGSLAALTPSQRATRSAGEDARSSERVLYADDRPLLVAQVGDQRRRDERSLPRLLPPAVDDLDDRPPAALAVDRRPPQAVAHGDQPADRRAWRHEQHRGTGAAGPFDDDVAGMPRRAALLLERFVMLVDHDDTGEVATRRPGGGAGSDDDVDARRSLRPLLWYERNCQSSALQPGCVGAGAVDRRHDDHDRAEPGGRRQDGQHVLGRWKSQHAATTPEQITGIAMDGLDGDLGSSLGWQCTDVRRRAGSDEERPQASCRPANRRPTRQVDQRRVGPTRADLGERSQLRDRRIVWVELDHPATHATSVQRRSHQRPDPHRGGQLVGDEVVELLVQPGEVGQDSGDGRTSDGQRLLAGGAGGGGSCRSPLPVDRAGFAGRSTGSWAPAEGRLDELAEQPPVARRNFTRRRPP